MSAYNLAGVLAHHADRFPDRPCLVAGDTTITYAELDRRAGRTAAGLALGVSFATLSGGERQMLAIGRALMSRPKLLMLDEPSAGLAPIVVREMMEKIQQVSTTLGTTILMVEQNIREAFRIVERVYVLKLGRIVFEDQPDVLVRDDRLRQAYLG